MAPRSSSPASPRTVTTDPLSRPDPSRPGGALTFRQPEEETSDPLSLPAVDDSPSLSGEPSDELPGPSEGPRTSSRGSSGSALSKRALRDAARAGVITAGGIAHQVLARDELEQQAGLYLADEDDAEAIGDPLANMANRRGGLGAAGNPDLADAIAALIGLALYIVKQLARWNAVKAARRAGVSPAEGRAERPAGDHPQEPTADAYAAQG